MQNHTFKTRLEGRCGFRKKRMDKKAVVFMLVLGHFIHKKQRFFELDLWRKLLLSGFVLLKFFVELTFAIALQLGIVFVFAQNTCYVSLIHLEIYNNDQLTCRL